MDIDPDKALTWGGSIIVGLTTAATTAWRLVSGRVEMVRTDLAKQIADHKEETEEKFKDLDSDFDADRQAASKSRERIFTLLDEIKDKQDKAHAAMRQEFSQQVQTLLSAIKLPHS